MGIAEIGVNLFELAEDRSIGQLLLTFGFIIH